MRNIFMASALMLFLPASANACVKGFAVDFASEMVKSIDYLSCVIQEQNTLILELQSMLLEMGRNKPAITPDDVADIRFRLRMVQEAVEKLAPSEPVPSSSGEGGIFWPAPKKN